MAFAWDIFAEEIGRVGQRAGARVAQRGIDKRAEERAYRMHEEKLKIEQPFKDLSNEQITARQKELADYRIELQKGLEEWQGELSRKLNMLAGKEGYQEAIKRARKDGGLSQVAIMQMEDVIMRLHRGEVPDEKDMAVFEALEPFDRLPFMDLFRQNQIIETQTRQAQERIDNMNTKLQNEADTRKDPNLIDMKRWMDMRRNLDADAEKAETAFHTYRSELINDLETESEVINVKGQLKVRGRRDKFFPLFNEDGTLNEEVRDKLTKKHRRYIKRFERLEVLRQNKEDRNKARDEFFGGEPAGGIPEVEVPEDWIKTAMAQEGLTREQAIAAYKRFKRK